MEGEVEGLPLGVEELSGCCGNCWLATLSKLSKTGT